MAWYGNPLFIAGNAVVCRPNFYLATAFAGMVFGLFKSPSRILSTTFGTNTFWHFMPPLVSPIRQSRFWPGAWENQSNMKNN
jgi:hypothetical protein